MIRQVLSPRKTGMFVPLSGCWIRMEPSRPYPSRTAGKAWGSGPTTWSVLRKYDCKRGTSTQISAYDRSLGSVVGCFGEADDLNQLDLLITFSKKTVFKKMGPDSQQGRGLMGLPALVAFA